MRQEYSISERVFSYCFLFAFTHKLPGIAFYVFRKLLHILRGRFEIVKDVVDFLFSKDFDDRGKHCWIWNAVMFGVNGGKDELISGNYKKVSRDELVKQ